MIKKVFGAIDYLTGIDNGLTMLSKSSFYIKKVDTAIKDTANKVDLKKMICNNLAPPRSVFIAWLIMLNRVVTCEYMQKLTLSISSSLAPFQLLFGRILVSGLESEALLKLG